MNTTDWSDRGEPTDRSVDAGGARATLLGLVAAGAVAAGALWLRRQADGPHRVLRFLGAHPDSTVLAVCQGLRLPLLRVLPVLDHLVLAGRVSGRLVAAGESGRPYRRLYRLAGDDR